MRLYSTITILLLMGVGVFLMLKPIPKFTEPEYEKPIFKEFMGVNVHNVEVNMNLLTPVFNLVRDYHTVTWVLPEKDTRRANYPYSTIDIGWHDRSGKVGHFDGIVNFEEIYSSWQGLDFETNVSLMFVQKGPENWTDLEADSYELGKDFASYFGPSGRGLVTSVEVGNEPVPHWNVADYERIFVQMAKGIRDGDPDIKILTAATQPGKHDDYSVPINIFRDRSELYDVIKVHAYAFKAMWPTFERSYPEDPMVNSMRMLENTIHWRNRFAPDKEIWITEFGYDSSNKTAEPGSDWSQLKVVNDEVQAQWLVRSYLEFSRLDIQRAYVYWFNDHDEFAFHASSGIMRLNQPKNSFWALKQMRELLGEFAFNKEIVRERTNVHLYEYINPEKSGDKIWVAWSPTGETHSNGTNRVKEVTIEVPSRPKAVFKMSMSDAPFTEESFTYSGNKITVNISESPVYFIF